MKVEQFLTIDRDRENILTVNTKIVLETNWEIVQALTFISKKEKVLWQDLTWKLEAVKVDGKILLTKRREVLVVQTMKLMQVLSMKLEEFLLNK